MKRKKTLLNPKFTLFYQTGAKKYLPQPSRPDSSGITNRRAKGFGWLGDKNG